MSTLSVNKITDLIDFTFPPTFTFPANATVNLTGVNASGASTFGSANITSNLSVTGTANVGNLSITSTSGRITGDFSNATIASRVAFQTSTTNGNATPLLLPNGTATTAGFLAFNNSDPTNASFASVLSLSGSMQVSAGITGTGTYQPMTFYTGGSERARIDTSGNVGIGVSPAYQFEIKTANDAILRTVNSGATQISQIQSTNLARSAYTPLSIGGSYTVLETGGSERMRIDSSGNMGIGTSSLGAGYRVSIVGSAVSSVPLYLHSDATNGYVYSPNPLVIGSTGAYTLSLVTNNTTRFLIGSAGQLGIGGATYGTSGQVLTSGGASAAPTWSTPAAASGTVTSITAGTGLSGGTITTSGTIALVTTSSAVGTYAFLYSALTSVTAGTSYAGSTLRMSGMFTTTGCFPALIYHSSATVLSGTWQAMGTYGPSNGSGATLYVRIA